jgi:YHS domain-containing protein
MPDSSIIGLTEFSRKIDGLLSKSNREPHWDQEEARRYMVDVAERRSRFEAIAHRLCNQVILPLVEVMASRLPNATLSLNEPTGRCVCWLGYCERFPASTKVGFSIEHDVRFEKVYACFEASMSPPFIKLNEHDKHSMLLDEVRDDDVSAWVQERLFEFLNDYLRIDRGLDDFEDETATDPVCGMRISHNHATASTSYIGRQYFFCSSDCVNRFLREPAAYVKVELD